MPRRCGNDNGNGSSRLITTLAWLTAAVGILGSFPACSCASRPQETAGITLPSTTTTMTTTQPSTITPTATEMPLAQLAAFLADDVDSTTTTSDTVNLTVVQALCWTNSDAADAATECSVAAEFHRVELRFKFPANIDCTAPPTPPWPVQYANISAVSLNGCNAGGRNTLGAEYVPDPSAVRRLRLRMFRVRGPIATGAFVGFAALVDLQLVDNIVDAIGDGSLRELRSLRSLTVRNNNLTGWTNDALLALPRLEELQLLEPQLDVGAALRLPPVLRTWLLHAGHFAWLRDWPPLLETLRIRRSPIADGADLAGTLPGLQHLHTLELTACQLTAWPAFGHRTLRRLNISHNQLPFLHDDLQLPALEVLDISANRLLQLSDTVLRPLRSLRTLAAQRNRLEQLANNAFGRNALLDSVDLSGNRLRQIAPNLSVQQQTRIRIDDNPWSCKWALDISGTHPQIFAHFRYAKTLDNVNMRGLRCRFYDSNGPFGAGTALPADWDVSNGGNRSANGSTTTTTTLRRHPKDTAMLTLIILVVGVTFLFMLLFLHIRCRREAMQPFYRSLPYDQQLQLPLPSPTSQPLPQQRWPQPPPANGQHTMTERTDFVRRELPATDYEAPILCRAGGRARTVRTASDSAATATGADHGDLAHRVYEVISECKPQSATQRSRKCSVSGKEATVAGDSIETAAPRPKQKYASMNNMLYDKSGNGGQLM